MTYPNAFCVKCGAHTETLQKHTVMLQSAARAVKGVCPRCANDVYRIVPKGKDYAAEAAAAAKTAHVPPPAAPVAPAPAPAKTLVLDPAAKALGFKQAPDRRRIPVAPRAGLARHAESVHSSQLAYVLATFAVVGIIMGFFAYAVW